MLRLSAKGNDEDSECRLEAGQADGTARRPVTKKIGWCRCREFVLPNSFASEQHNSKCLFMLMLSQSQRPSLKYVKTNEGFFFAKKF